MRQRSRAVAINGKGQRWLRCRCLRTHPSESNVKATILYVVITAVLTVLAVSMVAETPRPKNSPLDSVVEPNAEEIDRTDAVEIASRVISDANDDIDGRITLDAKKSPDGKWQVQARWTVEGAVHSATVMIDNAGSVIEYVK